jgi:putative membrane protein
VRVRVLARIAAIASFAVAFVALEDASRTSFAIHMTQHMVLMVVLAPLVVIGWPLHHPPKLLRSHAFAPVAVLSQTAALVVWHIPAVFDAAEANTALHIVEHLVLFATALGTWWVIIASPESAAIRFAVCTAAAAPMLLLGALLTFAPTVWYSAYAGQHGLSPIVDQQTGGAVMWGPAGIAYVIAAAWIVAQAITSDERFAPTRSG